MPEITCLFGRIGNPSILPSPGDWRYKGLDLAGVFSAASGGDIQLRMEPRLETPLPPVGVSPGTLQLHQALAALTGNDAENSGVRRIGVLFATTFAGNAQTLGIMFDRGFAVPDDQNTQFMQTPREGCAIFLQSIDALWKSEPEAVQREMQFTTAHEMGHVFNLEHEENDANFMQSSDGWKVYGEEHYQFMPRHGEFLRQCSAQRCIHPGGSVYGDRSDLGASFDPAESGNVVSRGGGGLRLKIETPTPSQWYCEPMELEIALSLPRTAAAVRVPDRLDPGYGEFTIWIEEPNQTRRRYRSPKFFCGPPQWRRILPGGTFRRDISLFGQSGGYTFHRAGVHRVWAEFRLSARRTLVSNKLELEMRSPGEGRRSWQRAEPVLRRNAGLLYYRQARDLAAAADDVVTLRRTLRGTATAAAAAYALGRAHAHRAIACRDSRTIRTHVESARRYLGAALDAGRLGGHAASRAREKLEEMEGRAAS